MATPGLDIPAQVLVAKQYGFRGIDFRVGEPGKGEIPEDISEESAAQVKEMMDGLALPGLLCYNKKLDDGSQEMVASLLRCIRLAQRVGCPMIRVFTGKVQSQEHLELLIQVLAQVLQQDDSGIKMGLQIHKNNGVTVHEGLQVCQALGSSRVGLILSPDQSYLQQEDWQPLISQVAKHTFQIYVADLNAQGDFCLIGAGVLPYKEILNQLWQNGFNGYVTLKWEKCWLPQLPDYPEGFRSFISYMNNSAQ